MGRDSVKLYTIAFRGEYGFHICMGDPIFDNLQEAERKAQEIARPQNVQWLVIELTVASHNTLAKTSILRDAAKDGQ